MHARTHTHALVHDSAYTRARARSLADADAQLVYIAWQPHTRWVLCRVHTRGYSVRRAAAHAVVWRGSRRQPLDAARREEAARGLCREAAASSGEGGTSGCAAVH
jgi:hypothetical protein